MKTIFLAVAFVASLILGSVTFAEEPLPPFSNAYLTLDFATQDAMLSYYFAMDSEQRSTAIIWNDTEHGTPYLITHRQRDGGQREGERYVTWTMHPYPGHEAGAASYVEMGFVALATGNPDLPFAIVLRRSQFDALGAERASRLDDDGARASAKE